MYEINKLTEFNPALIYGFEPESSPQRLSGSEKLVDTLLPEAGQHEDMLEAYLFAQDTILPFIRKNGFDSVDAEMLLGWIKTLHSLIGKSLLECQGGEAGKYFDQYVLRWHKGSQLNLHFIHYLSGEHYCKSDKQLINLLCKNDGLNKKEGLAFLKLLHQLKANANIEVDPVQIEFMKKNPERYHSGILTILKLVTAYNTGLLSEKEKSIVDKIAKVCILPYQVPIVMEEFAKVTIAKYKACDKADLNAIAHFLTEMFSKFTDIHPFPNANGRIATCLMNVFLRSLNLPSILLRHPGDKKNEMSRYSLAIEQINNSTKLLEELILNRIQDAQKETFSDEVLAKTVALRVGMSNLLKRIHQKHPDFNLELIRDEVDLSQILFISDKKDQSIFALTAFIAAATRIEKKLDQAQQPTRFSLPHPLNEIEKKQLIANLEQLSGQSGWKLNQKNGLVVWLEVPVITKACEITEKLQATGAMNVIQSQRQDNKIPVIKCDQINCQRLNELASSQVSLLLATEQNDYNII